MTILNKKGWFLVLATGLLACLWPSTILLAQEDKIDLYLRILPEHYYKEVVSGEESTFFMEVRNTGEKEITDITFESDEPEGWRVEILQKLGGSLAA